MTKKEINKERERERERERASEIENILKSFELKVAMFCLVNSRLQRTTKRKVAHACSFSNLLVDTSFLPSLLLSCFLLATVLHVTISILHKDVIMAIESQQSRFPPSIIKSIYLHSRQRRTDYFIWKQQNLLFYIHPSVMTATTSTML